jgi:hypothetical protein
MKLLERMRNNRDLLRLYIFLILAVIGILKFGVGNIVYSLISYYIIWHILQPCWWHYDLWHWGLVKTSNIVHSVHVLLYCVFFPHKPSGPIKVHLAHHKYYNTRNDQNTFKVSQGRLNHLFGKTLPLRTRSLKSVEVVIPDFKVWKICEEHYLKIFFISNVLLFSLSPKWFIFLHVIPFLLGKLNLVVKLHDIVWHYKPNENFSNKPYMFFVSFIDAWHEDHHRTPIILNFGTGWIKWINPQFYYLCLIDSSIRAEVFNFKNNRFVRLPDK